jgi:hypothetical protein
VTASWDQRSRSEQERVEALVLGQWLPAAVDFTVTWADLARDHGMADDQLTERADLDRFPPSRERDLLRTSGTGAPGILMRPTEDQVKARASGSALMEIARAIRRDARQGKRRALLTEYKPIHVHRGGADDELAIAFTRRDLDRFHRAGARAARVLGLDDRDYLVSAVPAGPRLGWWGVYHLALGASLLALHPRGADDGLEDCLASFSLLPVTAVAVTADEAIELATLAAADDTVGVDRVHTLVVVGVPPSEDVRGEIADAWRSAGANRDLRVRALWAPSEARALWAECAEGVHGLHTYPDMEILEVIDPFTGQRSDTDGDLGYTSAGWHGSALLRYQTGTYVSGIETAPCPACDRTVPRIVGDIYPAAWQPLAGTADGAERIDLRGVPAVLAGIAAIETWRVEVGPKTARSRADRVLVEVAGDIAEPEAEGIRRRLESSTGAGAVELDLQIVADRLVIDRRIEELGSAFADLT